MFRVAAQVGVTQILMSRSVVAAKSTTQSADSEEA